MRALVVLLACLAATPSAAAPPRPHVYLVIVDGLDASFVKPEVMPRLFGLVEHERERSSFFPAATVVMPARTNPNHVTLLTGVPAAVHGVTGNAYWSRVAGAPAEKLDDAALIEVETLFTVIETTDPGRVTLGAFGKPKLARLFGAVPDRQRAPDRVWTSLDLPPGRRDPATGYAADADTIAAALAAAAEAEPDLAVLNLADVDRAGHGYGPDTPEYRSAIIAADAALARLVADLRARDRWERSVLIVTADHGMAAIPKPPISLAAALGRDVTAVAEGGVEHVYANGPGGDALARAARVAAHTRGIAEVLARVPVEGVTALASAHPDWRLDHQRAGDLLLVAAPGYQFVDPPDEGPPLRGNHGAPGELHVPLVVTGGWPGLRAAPHVANGPSILDVAPTIVAMLGIRRPRRLDGSEIPPGDTGRVMDVLASQSPH